MTLTLNNLAFSVGIFHKKIKYVCLHVGGPPHPTCFDIHPHSCMQTDSVPIALRSPFVCSGADSQKRAGMNDYVCIFSWLEIVTFVRFMLWKTAVGSRNLQCLT